MGENVNNEYEDSHKKVVRKTLGVIILVAMFLLFIYNYPMSVAKTVKQLMIEDYGFTENEVCTLF